MSRAEELLEQLVAQNHVIIGRLTSIAEMLNGMRYDLDYTTEVSTARRIGDFVEEVNATLQGVESTLLNIEMNTAQ